MWEKIYSKTFTGVKKEAVWKILTDINNWHQWHDDLDYCKLEGHFKAGSHFMLKPKTMSAVKIMLTEVNHGSSFTDCTTFFGAKMYDTHALEQTPEGLKLINTLIVTGPLRWLWIKLVAQHVANSIPEETENLIALARKRT
jgi:hypothetical protein